MSDEVIGKGSAAEDAAAPEIEGLEPSTTGEVPEVAGGTDGTEAPDAADVADAAEGETVAEPGEVVEEIPVPVPAEHVALVEAMLFASGKPVPVDKLAEASELDVPAIERALQALEKACEAPGRGVRLDRVAGGVRIVSRVEHDYPIRRLLGLDGRTKLSIAALETLAIIAYRQPITAPEVAELRGVSSASSIRTLLDRKLITTAGRKEVVGTPFLYKTTKEFLIHFGISELKELPKPEELEALYGIEPPPPPDPLQPDLFPTDEIEAPAETAAEPKEPDAS